MPEPDIDLARYQKLLIKRKDALIAVKSSAHDASRTVTLDQSCVGRLSRMDALQSQAMSIETEKRRQLELQRIESALIRINNHDYGYCLDCDEPINPLRLASDPAAILCISCASKREASQ